MFDELEIVAGPPRTSVCNSERRSCRSDESRSSAMMSRSMSESLPASPRATEPNNQAPRTSAQPASRSRRRRTSSPRRPARATSGPAARWPRFSDTIDDRPATSSLTRPLRMMSSMTALALPGATPAVAASCRLVTGCSSRARTCSSAPRTDGATSRRGEPRFTTDSVLPGDRRRDHVIQVRITEETLSDCRPGQPGRASARTPIPDHFRLPMDRRRILVVWGPVSRSGTRR